ncbi:MAG TPA: HNH endonuclease signature motif containing protein [Pseudolabrys sp.]|jgi:hypothetical protein|nr:HNH endonuclease signature motif containing protein [Pseudolabrys sp.]
MLTAKRLREVLQYNSRTGLFRWRTDWTFVRKGDVAGTIRENGYRQIRVDGSIYMASRLAVLWMTGHWPKRIVDHRDRNKSNDRWGNLREATFSQNGANMRGRSQTGFKGVTLDRRRGRFSAYICKQGHRKCLGQFDRAQDAHAAYVDAAKRCFGQFARYQ